MFDHATVGNNSLGESVVDFSLVGDLSPPSIVSIKTDIAFAADNDKISLLIEEALLRATAGDLTRSNKQRHWTPRNSALIPPFLTEAAVLHRELDAGETLEILARSITEWATEGEKSSREDDNNDDDEYRKGGVEAEDEKTTKKDKANQANAKTLSTIADNCDDVLGLHHAVAVKSPQVIAVPLSFCAEKRMRVWLRCCTDINFPTTPKTAPQDHMGLTGVLTDVSTRLHTTEALLPIVAAHYEVEK